MKEIMISIKPEWVAKILNGEKTIEIRKSMPKCELPCKVYIYCTKSQKKLLTIFRKGDLIWSDDKDEQRFDETIFVKDDYFGIADERHRWLGKVVAEFTFKYFNASSVEGILKRWADLKVKDYFLNNSCLTEKQLLDYIGDMDKNKFIYLWMISELKIYDKPKELAEFGLKRPFQSWGYVKGEQYE